MRRRLELVGGIAWRAFALLNVLAFLGWNVAAWVYLFTAHAWLVNSPWNWCGGLAVQSACR